MCAAFKGKLSTKIVSYYSFTNVSDVTEISAFYNELSSLIQHICKPNTDNQRHECLNRQKQK